MACSQARATVTCQGGKSLQQVKQERGADSAGSKPAPQDLRDTHWR